MDPLLTNISGEAPHSTTFTQHALLLQIHAFSSSSFYHQLLDMLNI